MPAVSIQPNDCYITFTNLVTDTEIFQNFGKCGCKIEAGMGTCHLNEIKQHRDQDTILFKMDANSDICLVVWRCPSIRCKAKSSIVFLVNSGKFFVGINQKRELIQTCRVFAMCFRTFRNTLFTSRETVCGEGKRYPGHPVFMSD